MKLINKLKIASAIAAEGKNSLEKLQAHYDAPIYRGVYFQEAIPLKAVVRFEMVGSDQTTIATSIWKLADSSPLKWENSPAYHKEAMRTVTVCHNLNHLFLKNDPRAWKRARKQFHWTQLREIGSRTKLDELGIEDLWHWPTDIFMYFMAHCVTRLDISA